MGHSVFQADGLAWVIEHQPQFILTDAPKTHIADLISAVESYGGMCINVYHAPVDSAHPGAKSVSVFNQILEAFPGQSVVVDPFMGSGTTGVSAITCGREFIGIDSKSKWVEFSRKRLDAFEDPLDDQALPVG